MAVIDTVRGWGFGDVYTRPGMGDTALAINKTDAG